MTAVNSYIEVNWNNMTTFGDFLTKANQSGAGYLFAGIDFLVFFILFVTLAGVFGWESSLLASSFIGLLLSLLFVYMGVLNFWIAGVFVGLIIAMIMYIIWGNRYD